MAEILSIISIISFVCSGICLALSIFFWFKFKIPSVIGDLTGKTAQKSIQRIREDNEKSGNKLYRPGAVNVTRGKTTSRLNNSRKLLDEKKDTGSIKQSPKLDRIENQDIPQSGMLNENFQTDYYSNKTVVLQGNNNANINIEQTALLQENYKTEVLQNNAVNNNYSNDTGLLETGLLSDNAVTGELNELPKSKPQKFIMLEEIMYVHTNEVI